MMKTNSILDFKIIGVDYIKLNQSLETFILIFGVQI